MTSRKAARSPDPHVWLASLAISKSTTPQPTKTALPRLRSARFINRSPRRHASTSTNVMLTMVDHPLRTLKSGLLSTIEGVILLLVAFGIRTLA
eukprot:6015288-Pyramimonas_sp.AAC.1